MSQTKILSPLLAGLLLAGVATATTGADITVLKLGSNASDYVYYGQTAGIAAYSMATTACNPGTIPVNWTNADHPIIGQNIFRLRNGLFEQLGQSWLKHGFCAVNEPGCGSCQSTPCDTLGIGCADTYWGTLNDGQGGGPKWQVNATSGVHQHPYPAPTGLSTIRGRLQVLVADIDPTLPENQDAVYFAEGQYVSAHDASQSNAANNNSWQLIGVTSIQTLFTAGPTHIGESALFGWRSIDPNVRVSSAINVDEGGVGKPGIFWVASRAYGLGNGTWRYVYVVHNLTSTQSAGSLSIPVSDQLSVSNFYFRDVPYHSGEPYDGSDWTGAQVGGEVGFVCPQTFQQNPNANAIRWGTAYTFAFETNAMPVIAMGSEIGLFGPGPGSVVPFLAWIPGTEPVVGTPFCSGDGSGTDCPCMNFGDTGRGCANGSFAAGAELAATGTASVGNDSLVLSVAQSTPLQPGLFFQGDAAVNGGAGVSFGDGLRCAGQNVVRLEAVTSGGSGNAASSIDISQAAGLSAGDVKRYQYWYRDPNLSPCGAGFNTSNGLEVSWSL